MNLADLKPRVFADGREVNARAIPPAIPKVNQDETMPTGVYVRKPRDPSAKKPGRKPKAPKSEDWKVNALAELKAKRANIDAAILVLEGL